MTMEEALHNWEPTDLDLADLQCLARQYCKIVGIRQIDLAKLAASQLTNEFGNQLEIADFDAKTDFNLFLSRWYAQLVSRIRPYATILVRTIISHAESRPRDKNAARLSETCKSMVLHPNFREVAAGSDFMAVRDSWRTTELLEDEEGKKDAKSENSLFIAFSRLAKDFSYYSHDAHLRHDRIKPAPAPNTHIGNGTHGPNKNGQFVLIRRSSQTPENFVAHAMFIGVHSDEARVLYFSEQLRALEGNIETNRRMTQGICIFDGQHMTAIARPRFNTYFTYITAKIDDIDAPLAWFRAIIVTANRNSQRISAEALCFRCADRTEREKKVGVFAARDLKAMFQGPQLATLENWIATAPPVIVL